MGAAMRFMTSEPVPIDHMIGMSPTAPWTIASWRSAIERRRPFAFASS